MAKKIKFGLKMADDVDVRSIEDLRKHFDLVKAIEHFTSGKLLEWLEDRFYDEAEKIGQLDKDALDFQRQLCEILGVDPQKYANVERDVDAIARAKEKEIILKQKTSDEQIIANAAKTAFDRDDLVELWGAGEDTIYLCGGEFNIPLRVENVKYIGILGTPKITISAKSREELAEKGIEFENVELPEALREKKAEETKACPKCGQENPLSAKFCNGCGAAMDGLAENAENRETLADTKKEEKDVNEKLPPDDFGVKKHLILPVRFGKRNLFYNKNYSDTNYSQDQFLEQEEKYWDWGTNRQWIDSYKKEIDDVLVKHKMPTKTIDHKDLITAIDKEIGMPFGYTKEFLDEKLNSLDTYSKLGVVWELKRLLAENFYNPEEFHCADYTISLAELMRVLDGETVFL